MFNLSELNVNLQSSVSRGSTFSLFDFSLGLSQ